MKLIVGLGNPGEKYEQTRHNVGFMVLDQLFKQVTSDKFQVSSKFLGEIVQTKELILLKPTTFMNKSGQSVSAVVRFYKLKYEDIYVVHDDLDIALGEYKLQFAKGPQLHYGVESIEIELGTKDFWRVRVGVENRGVKGNKGVPGEVYSLQNFSPEEKLVFYSVANEVIQQIASVIS